MSKKKRSDTTKAYNDDVTITSLLRNVTNVRWLLETGRNSKISSETYVSHQHPLVPTTKQARDWPNQQ